MEIKAYKNGDEVEILKLFRLAFGKEMSIDYWKWRFMNNPFSKEPYIDLMWEEGKLVGHYAVSPVDMVINGVIRTTALSMTTMTHPDFGGKGIFSSLANSLYRRLKVDGFSIVWGFPNNNSHYGFKKNLDWSDITIQEMMALTLPAITKNIINIPIAGTTLKCTEMKMEDLTELLNGSEKYIRLHKTGSFLRWRYAENPSFSYKVAIHSAKRGVLIYKVIPSLSDSSKKEIDIMDWEFDNDRNLALELLAIVYHREDNIVQFNLWNSLFSERQMLLEKIGFKFQTPLTYLGYRCLNLNDAEIGDYRNWDLSLCYSDVF